MKYLGYQWSKAKKHSYSDRHEDPLTIAYRTEFVRRYMFEYEPRAHRWIRIEKVDADHLRKKKMVPDGTGFDFVTPEGVHMTEFHVDDNVKFQATMNETERFGGTHSSLFINAPSTVIAKWKADGWLPLQYGTYKYKVGEIEMTEVHGLQFNVEHRDNLMISLRENDLHFGVSVRLPLLMMGQDEVIFKQYISSFME